MTHAHPLGIDGAVLLAGAIIAVVGGDSADQRTDIDLTPIAEHLTTPGNAGATDGDHPAGVDPEGLMRLEGRFGSRVVAVQSVPTALAVFLVHRDDPLATITAAITFGRDTDTVAAMAGALAGAQHGATRLPEHLLERLEDRDRTEALAQQLAALR